jgi:hypothetical protein
MMPSAEWFVIKSGPDEGTINMAGWSFSAHLGLSTSLRNDRDAWLAFATCPRCFAMVLNSETGNRMLSREIQLHNAWHSNTDHPIPPEVTAEQDRVYRALTKGQS